MEVIILLCLFSILSPALAGLLNPTDTITWGGDISRAGYQPTHNMDPSVVGSAQFGQLFKTILPGNYRGNLEQIYSQPLVYTLNDGIQYVFVATTQNNVYKINAKTGVVVSQRNLHIPFLTADLNGCVDINPLVGVTATGVIDPDTDTWYLTAKTYADQTDQLKGVPNGRYYVHAIDVNTLTERPNFPVGLEGMVGRNNPNRMFNGGIHHQRPALLQAGQFIYAGFASHCVQWNFTGWVVGWDKSSGAIVEHFVTEAGPEPNTVPGGGIWMSGGGLASDGQGSMFFATGNGFASQLSGTSVPGRQPPSSLEEAAVHMKINDDGTLTVVDFFMPWEKTQLDGADKDLGTTPLELLPTSTFTCPNVQRMGVVTGKSGKTYVLNLDNLGGYQMGANHLDAIPYVYQNENSVYAGAGVYPLEGGYIYINVIQYQTHVFKFSCDGNGNPVFTKVGDSPDKNAYILGVGHGTVTSLNGQAGTGLVWTSDVEGYNLRIYNAVPVNGLMTLIKSFNIVGVTKFTRPVFGDGRVYIGTVQGALYGFGSPVNLPLSCSSPYDFGTVVINSSSTAMTVQCQATSKTQITSINLAGNPNFVISGLPTLPYTLQAGNNISFQATFSPRQVGPLSSDVLINTTTAAAGFSANTPISLKGIGQSHAPILMVNPNTVSFNGVVTGQEIGGVNSSVLLINQGDAPLTITSIDYSLVSEGGATVAPNSTAAGPRVGPFTFINLPSSIPGNSEITVAVNFNPSTSGNFAAYLTVHSNGGDRILDVVGTSGTYPVALVEFQAADGSGTWIPYSNTTAFTFGSVLEQQTKSLQMRLTNKGDSNAGRLSVTVSKPPFGVAGIIGAVNGVDLAEGTTLAAGESATATLFCSVPKSQVNVDPYNGTAQWTMNTGDPNAGKMFIQFFCNAVSEQVGLLAANGSAIYRYDGCFVENNPGRQLSAQLYGSADNTNDKCITTCAGKGYKYCATQYQVECWGGNSIPVASTLGRDCGYPCAGNGNETCGGNGYFQNGTYMSLFVNPSLPEGAPLPAAGGGGANNPNPPTAVQSVGNWTLNGCITEATAGRALSGKALSSDDMTVEYCVGNCTGYAYAGVEYGRECYCGNIIDATSTSASISDCSMGCAGNSTEVCGAGGRLSLYSNHITLPSTSIAVVVKPAAPPQIGNHIFLGCYTEATTGRALTGAGSADINMTPELCHTSCSSYAYFGVEYGQECYCGNTLASGSIITAIGDCSMTCPGNTTELCGAGNRLEMYYSNQTQTITTAPTTAAASTTTTAPTTTTALTITTPKAPATPATVGPYSYLGCYTEATNGRALASGFVANDSMTLEYCASQMAQYTYFGVEYGRECYGSNTLAVGCAPALAADCSMTCAGNNTELCGAGNRLQLYSRAATSTSTTPTTLTTISASTNASSSAINTTSSVTIPVSSTSTTPVSFTSTTLVSSTSTTPTSTPTPTGPIIAKIAGYNYLGCWTEATNARTFAAATVAMDNMTVEYCAQLMSKWTYFGVEYGRECYGANAFSAGSILALTSDCNQLCAGNPLEYCGAGNRLNAYQVSNITTYSTSTSVATLSTVASTTAVNTIVVATTGISTTVVSSSTTSTPVSASVNSTSSSVASSTLSVSVKSSTSSLASSTVSASVNTTTSSVASSTSTSVSSTISSIASSTISTSVKSTTNVASSTASPSANSTTSSVASSTASTTVSTSANSTTSSVASSVASSTASISASTSVNSTTSSPVSKTASTSASTSVTTSVISTTSAKASSTASSSTSTSAISMSSSKASSAASSSISTAVTSTTSSKASSTTSSSTSTTSATPTPTGRIVVQGNTNFTYYRCLVEPTNARALPKLVAAADNMTVPYCLSLAWNYKWVGLEYGRECWAANTLTTGTLNATKESECGMACAGNKTTICGDGNRLTAYHNNVTLTA